jgi:hypothetical protein
LTERKTDQIYSDIIDFLVEAYTDKRNFEFKSEKEAEEYLKKLSSLENYGEEPEEFSPEEMEKINARFKELEKYTAFEYRFKLNEARIYDLYDKMIKEIPESIEIFSPPDIFYNLLIGFELVFEYNDKKGYKLGSFDNSELRVNFAAALKSAEGTGIRITKKEFANLKDAGTFLIMSKNKDILQSVMEHEFTHMINYARAGGKGKNLAKGLKRHQLKKRLSSLSAKEPEIAELINSTEEIQARIIPIFKMVNTVIKGKDYLPTTQSAVAEKIAIEVGAYKEDRDINNIRSIVEKLFEMYSIYSFGDILQYTTEKNIKRITKRFYDFANQLVKEE